MPNYRYRSTEYMRRANGAKTAAVPASQCCRQTAAEPVSVSAPACCDSSAEYDELGGMTIAMAYVPWQDWRALYEADKGFCRGTIFEELDKPFTGIGGRIR